MMKHDYFYWTLLFWICLLFTPAAATTEAPSAESSFSENMTSWVDSSLETTDETHALISEKIVSTSDYLDSFFGSERMDEEGNQTKIRLNLVSKIDDEGQQRFKVNVAFVLVLPKTQNRLNLVVEDVKEQLTDDDESNPVEVSSGQDALSEPVSDTTLSTALRYAFIDTEELSVKADSGVIAKIPLEPFVKLRLRRSYKLDKWEARATQNIKWSLSRDWEESTGLVFDRPLTQKLLFRISNVLSWQRRDPIFLLKNTLSLFQQLSRDRALVYFTGMKSIDTPTIHVTGYNVGVTYRQMIYKKWIFFQVQPVLAFPRGEDFELTPSITFKLEFIFGGIH